MESFFGTVKLLIVCGTAVLLLFLVLLALPKSQLRNLMVQVLGWAFAAFCGLYVVSPIDIVPDFIPVVGWLDDGGAIVGGIASALVAHRAGKERGNL